MGKPKAWISPLIERWEAECNQLNLKKPPYRDAIKSHLSSIEFPIHLRDIVDLGLIATPITENGDYYVLDSEYPGKLVSLEQALPEDIRDKVTNPVFREVLLLPKMVKFVNYFPWEPAQKLTVIRNKNEFFVSQNCGRTLHLLQHSFEMKEQMSYLKDEYAQLFEKRNDEWWLVGLFPLQPTTDEILRNIYHDTFMNLLMLSVRSKRANSETILIRKSAREQFEDTELKIPQSYFHLPSKAFHFIDEVNNISYIVSVKRGELQVVKILPPANDYYHNFKTGFSIPKDLKVNLLDEIVINIDLEDITDNEGHITTKSIKNGFDNYFNQNKYEQHYYIGAYKGGFKKDELLELNNGAVFENILNRFGNVIGNSPHMAVLSQLLTGVRLNSGWEETLSKLNSPLLEDFCKDTEFIIKLLGFMQDPRQKEIIQRDTKLYRKEYKRGTKLGDEIKYRVWGQNVSIIRHSKDSKTTGAKNRSHYVNGHIRKQPIKDVQKYEEKGYVVNTPHDNPFVEMFIEPHWRGNKELGEITTILMFGKQASGWSRKAIDWLKSISAKEKIEIKHALNGGEYAFSLGNGKMARVDGFCQSTNTVYEFYGDYYHGNPKKYGADEYNKTCKKTQGELYDLTMKREQMIISLGFNFVCIWECDWNNS